MPTLAEIDLKPFCYSFNTVSSKYDGAAQPWTAGEWTYATDARILIRVPRRELPEPEGRVPDVSSQPWDAEGDWKSLPAVETLRTSAPCGECGGKGMQPAYVRCPTCEDKVPLPGNDKVPCEDCVGGAVSVKIDGVIYATKYLAKIAALPGVEYIIQPHAGARETHQLLHFRFDGGRGMLMPMKGPAKS